MKKVLSVLAVLALVFCLGFGAANTVLAADAPEEEAGATDAAVTALADTVEAADAPLVEDEGQADVITQAVNNVVSAVIKLVFAGITLVLSKYAIPFAKKTVAPFIRQTIIPWFEEHRLRSIVDRLVHGAEQLANSGQLPKADKKQYVVDMLTAMGIEVTPEVDAIIEGAVLDLDKTLKELLQAVLDDIKDKGAAAPEPDPVPQVEPSPEKGEAANAGEA